MASKGYTNKLNIENYLLITIDSSFDSQVDDWIAAMETYIEQITGRFFTVEDTASDRLYDGDGSNTLFIDDASEVTDVALLDSEGTPTTELTYADKDYYLYPTNETILNRIVLKNGVRFASGHQNVLVTGKWGQALPADVMFAATVLVAGIVNFSNSSEGEIQSMSIGRYSVTYKTEAQKEDFTRANEILKTYKRYGTF